ncbi:MAG: hypothetical protein Q8Q09_27970 [Deltaproteobacteria bacterium]|nr:hypothetical protein [Deltaproteobacteria bacterium]
MNLSGYTPYLVLLLGTSVGGLVFTGLRQFRLRFASPNRPDWPARVVHIASDSSVGSGPFREQSVHQVREFSRAAGEPRLLWLPRAVSFVLWLAGSIAGLFALSHIVVLMNGRMRDAVLFSFLALIWVIVLLLSRVSERMTALLRSSQEHAQAALRLVPWSVGGALTLVTLFWVSNRVASPNVGLAVVVFAYALVTLVHASMVRRLAVQLGPEYEAQARAIAQRGVSESAVRVAGEAMSVLGAADELAVQSPTSTQRER